MEAYFWGFLAHFYFFGADPSINSSNYICSFIHTHSIHIYCNFEIGTLRSHIEYLCDGNSSVCSMYVLYLEKMGASIVERLMRYVGTGEVPKGF